MQVAQYLQILLDAGLVRPVEGRNETCTFKHVLVQETAYASLLRQERRELHSVIAELYQRLAQNETDDLLVEIARHLSGAGRNHEAAHTLTRYAEHAMRLSAYPEAIQAFEQAIYLTNKEAYAERARLEVRLGDAFSRQAEYQTAEGKYRAALEIATRHGDRDATATALSGLARLESQRGNHVRARELGEEGLYWARESGDAAATARALRQLGVAYNYDGNNSAAMAALQESLQLARAQNDPEAISSCLNSLGVVAREQGDLSGSAAYFEEALALSRMLNDRYGVGVRLINLGVIAEMRGDLDRALEYQHAALTLAREIGDREGEAIITLNLGSLALERGEHAQALHDYGAALRQAIAISADALALYCIAAVAKLYVKRGDREAGTRLFRFVLAHPGAAAEVRNDFASLLRDLELDQPAGAEASPTDGELTLKKVIQEILQDDAN